MCGIFGLVSTSDSTLEPRSYKTIIDNLFLVSESRGKDAAGLLLIDQEKISIIKRPVRAKKLIHSKEYKQLFDDFSKKYREYHEPTIFMGHARMVTNGSQDIHENNQPVIYPEACVLHNGIIVNDLVLWQKYSHLVRKYQVDTEIILALYRDFLAQGLDTQEAFIKTYSLLKGANSIAFIPNSGNSLILASSNGSLYYSISKRKSELLFASEYDFLNHVHYHPALRQLFDGSPIMHITAGDIYHFDINQLNPQLILSDKSVPPHSIYADDSTKRRHIVDLSPSEVLKPWISPQISQAFYRNNDQYFEKVRESVSRLKRCSRCVLPESFPNIEFDEYGVCNYCRNHIPIPIKGIDSLKHIISKYKNNDQPDCLVPVSGGRDSSYSLHVIKHELGLNPIAYTYDWGMVTDLARRNISRMCGSLGIEHILVSADIKSKRKNIQSNVLAWLRKPVLGTIPLFMAGDKQYFIHAYKIKESYKLQDIIMGENHYEKTLFKTAFSGAKQTSSGFMAYHISGLNKTRMAAFYGRQFILNPSYINQSLIDTLTAFVSFYLIPHHYINLFDFINWDEHTVTKTLIDQYDWECAKDTQTTWRIGDGTAPFYNYIYLNMAGFTENDTFRSNQIRAGVLSRKEALSTVNRDNEPLYDSIKWYCDTIHIDMADALNKINQAKKIYSH